MYVFQVMKEIHSSAPSREPLWAKSGLFLLSFHPFLNTMTYTSGIKSTINGKRVDGVLGIRTLDHEMESADEATDLWQLAYSLSLPN